MIKYESYKVQEIDNRILAELRRKLEFRKEKANILEEDEMQKILERIEEKKQAIFSLFRGNFSLNEQNIKERIKTNSRGLTLYDQVANNVILKRVEKMFNTMISHDPENNRLIAVCGDRQMFIQKVLEENVEPALIEQCIERESMER